MFVVVGLLATAIVIALTSRWAFWLRTIVIGAAAGTILGIGLSGGVQTRGGLAWWDEPLWRNLLLYVAMLTGMMPPSCAVCSIRAATYEVASSRRALNRPIRESKAGVRW